MVLSEKLKLSLKNGSVKIQIMAPSMILFKTRSEILVTFFSTFVKKILLQGGNFSDLYFYVIRCTNS